MKRHIGRNATTNRMSYLSRAVAAVAFCIIAPGLCLAQAAPSSSTAKIEDGWQVPVSPGVKGTLKIALNDGVHYAPEVLIRDKRVLETMFPNASIQWIQLNSTAQIRDGIVSGDIDAGVCSPLPYLLGWSAGVDWKLLTKTGEFNAILFTHKDGPSSIAELLKTTGKIGGGPGTAYDFGLQKALKDLGVNQTALRLRLVLLSHGDAMAAFATGQLDADFTPANSALDHIKRGDKQIADLTTIFGADNFIGVCTTLKAQQKSPELIGGLNSALRQVVDWLNKYPDAAANAVSKSTGGQVSPEDIKETLKRGLVGWSYEDADMAIFAKAMKGLGLLKRDYKSADDFYIFPKEAGAKW